MRKTILTLIAALVLTGGIWLRADPKNRDQIITMARQLLQGGNPGIFSTVDQSGFPQSRWMATMSFDDFPDLYTFDLRHEPKSRPNQVASDRPLDVFQPRLELHCQLDGGGNLFARGGRDEADLAANRAPFFSETL
jgi:hypothetical protein